MQMFLSHANDHFSQKYNMLLVAFKYTIAAFWPFKIGNDKICAYEDVQPDNWDALTTISSFTICNNAYELDPLNEKV